MIKGDTRSLDYSSHGMGFHLVGSSVPVVQLPALVLRSGKYPREFFFGVCCGFW